MLPLLAASTAIGPINTLANAAAAVWNPGAGRSTPAAPASDSFGALGPGGGTSGTDAASPAPPASTPPARAPHMGAAHTGLGRLLSHLA